MDIQTLAIIGLIGAPIIAILAIFIAGSAYRRSYKDD